MDLSEIRGIVFDKDGTLFDFNATWGAVTGQLIAGESKGDAGVAARLCNALGFDAQTNRFRPGSVVIAETSHRVSDVIASVTGGPTTAIQARMAAAARGVSQVTAAPLVPLMKTLRARGLVLGVATNDGEASAQTHLQDHDINTFFDFIAGFDSGYGAKPRPGQLNAFCAATGLPPSACAMVGDSLHDLHAGRAAGMVTVGVLTGPAPREELATAADVVLGSIAEIPAWLDRMA